MYICGLHRSYNVTTYHIGRACGVPVVPVVCLWCLCCACVVPVVPVSFSVARNYTIMSLSKT
jgi:hypothetical protein